VVAEIHFHYSSGFQTVQQNPEVPLGTLKECWQSDVLIYQSNWQWFYIIYWIVQDRTRIGYLHRVVQFYNSHVCVIPYMCYTVGNLWSLNHVLSMNWDAFSLLMHQQHLYYITYFVTLAWCTVHIELRGRRSVKILNWILACKPWKCDQDGTIRNANVEIYQHVVTRKFWESSKFICCKY